MISAAELLVTIQTHKLVYAGGCMDITSDVIAQLDEDDSKVKGSDVK